MASRADTKGTALGLPIILAFCAAMFMEIDLAFWACACTLVVGATGGMKFVGLPADVSLRRAELLDGLNTYPAFWLALSTGMSTRILALTGAAVLRGGPGVIPWMLIFAIFFGGGLKCFEVSTLAHDVPKKAAVAGASPQETCRYRLGPCRYFEDQMGPAAGWMFSLTLAIMTCMSATDSEIFQVITFVSGKASLDWLTEDLRMVMLIMVVLVAPLVGGIRDTGRACQALLVNVALPLMAWIGICALVTHYSSILPALGKMGMGFFTPWMLGYEMLEVAMQGMTLAMAMIGLHAGRTPLLYGAKTPKALAVCDFWIRIAVCVYVGFLIVLAGEADDRKTMNRNFKTGAHLVQASFANILEGRGTTGSTTGELGSYIWTLLRLAMNLAYLLAMALTGLLAADWFEGEFSMPRMRIIQCLRLCAYYWFDASPTSDLESNAQPMAATSLATLITIFALMPRALGLAEQAAPIKPD